MPQPFKRPSIVPRAVAPLPAGDQPLSLKISSGYGRLYVGGPSHRLATKVRGAVINDRRGVVEVALTMDTLRELRKLTGLEPGPFASFCTTDVLNWAKAAGKTEKHVAEIHAQIEAGWRNTFPWHDSRAHTPVGADARHREQDVYTDEQGVLRWAYRAPYDHQQIMASVASAVDGVAFLAEMGTGKTRPGATVIEHHFRHRNVDVGFVICPRGVIGTWKRQFAEWTKGITVINLIDMPVKQREASIRSMLTDRWRGLNVVFVTNYDVLAKLKDAIIDVCKVRKAVMLCDEMHRVANPQTATAKALLAITPYVAWRLGMTGTPVRNGGHDVWSQWYFIDMGVEFGANFVQFKRDYFTEDAWTHGMEAKPGALDTIGAKLRKRGLRYTKADCLDLPPKVYDTVNVTMTPPQLQAYRDMEEQLVAVLTGQLSPSTLAAAMAEDAIADDKLATASTQLVAILRLTQITSGFVGTEAKTLHRFVPNPKLDALEEIVREAIPTEQILVWARYREDHRAIMERLADLNPRLIVGGVKQADRDETEIGFQEGRYRLIVGHPTAGGVGLNLQAASLACYYSQGYSLIDREQSEDRSHRSGSERHEKITYLDFIVDNSIDVVISQAIAQKKSIAAVVVDLKRVLGINA